MHGTSVSLDGDGWGSGPLVALAPKVVERVDAGADLPARQTALARVAKRVESRRRSGDGRRGTGIVLLLGYDFWRPQPPARTDENVPDLLAIEVDRAAAVDSRPGRQPERAARVEGPVRTSLARQRYIEAVRSVQDHIAAGDIYQANVCQRFAARYTGDPFGAYRDLCERHPAPMAAFVEVPGLAIASISPETFLRVREGGRIETRPIKGTRPRFADDALDRASAARLEASAKDRAELTMIVDVERNDLGRVCATGSVEVPELGALRSFPTVHHLVATVRGRLRPDAGVAEILDATFPGGSITGAPKLRAIEILERIEPVRRNVFTGSLCWLGDDGSIDSSILIRTLVFERGHVFLGAGGGITADSDPEAEWEESIHKARAPAEAIGFRPEDAR